ncbi:MAG: plasmid mobilization relaxosome protein MobC [Clostridia bacterium]|nr:plasmid mobilization relaxosome protein MobC [Clostridia bacterium]
MGEKRKRDKTLTIRLTESEKMMIEKKASKAKLNLTEYIISVSSKSKISVAEDTKPLLLELKRIGNNINQIAMKINSGVVSSYNFDEVISMQRKIYEQLLLLVGKN